MLEFGSPGFLAPVMVRVSTSPRQQATFYSCSWRGILRVVNRLGSHPENFSGRECPGECNFSCFFFKKNIIECLIGGVCGDYRTARESRFSLSVRSSGLAASAIHPENHFSGFYLVVLCSPEGTKLKSGAEIFF